MRGLLIFAIVLFAIGCFVFLLPKSETPPPNEPGQRLGRDFAAANTKLATFSGSSSCKQCHEKQYDSWHQTYHRTMTQKADESTVVGDFEDVRLEAYGRQYHLQHKEDGYFVSMVDPKWETDLLLGGASPAAVPNPPVITARIVQTTGSHHMQTYWIEAEDGLRQVPWFYHIEENMWIASEDSFLTPPGESRVYAIWEMQCLKCHSTGGQPRMDQHAQKFHGAAGELGIACEACHGSAAAHVAWHQESDRDENSNGDPIFNPSQSSAATGSEACGQCHSSSQWHDQNAWLELGSPYRPGQPFADVADYETPVDDDRNPMSYRNQGFWSDGTCRVGGDEMMGMMESKCFTEGELSCMSCHSMHDSDPSDQLSQAGLSNAVCIDCHASYEGERLREHTHHQSDSAGSLCYNCHMPHTSYALFKGLRSHRIDSPQASTLGEGNRPNACNLCHLDTSLGWTAEHLVRWYDQAPPEKQLPKELAASVDWLVRGDAVQRAVTAWSFGWPESKRASGDQWQGPVLASMLTDPYAAVRFISWRSLKTYQGLSEVDFEFTNNLRARVQQRDAAINLLKQRAETPAPVPGVPSEDYPQILKTLRELRVQRDDRPIHIPE